MLAKRCAEFKKGRPRVKPGVTVIYRHFSLSYIIQIGSKSFRFIPGDSGDGAMARVVERGSRGKSGAVSGDGGDRNRSEEHTSELQSLMSNSYAVFCLNTKRNIIRHDYDAHRQRQQINTM